MSTAIVLFTRDLRLNDNPALDAASRSADHVIPLFVLDEAILASDFNRPNRAQFLVQALADLDEQLKARGAGLVIRRGDPAREVARLAAEFDAREVHLAADYTRHAVRRQARLADTLQRRQATLHHSHVVVPPGDITPAGNDHYAVFSAYYRCWQAQPMRAPCQAPATLTLPTGIEASSVPSRQDICPGTTSPELPRGGEAAARARADHWFADEAAHYDRGHDDVAADATSRLSPYLHFGCISPIELARRAQSGNHQAFIRQLAWRDFHHQVLAVRPDVATTDYRTRHDRWHHDDDALRAWQDGRTGYPFVDAGMRQLQREGWMHNRARLVTASFLTKHLYLDWRQGARHFSDLLVDGDVVNNTMNWQWVAGTGTDTRPNRVLNPTLQQKRYDADRHYAKRYIDELGTPDYPDPIVDHHDAVAAFRQARDR